MQEITFNVRTNIKEITTENYPLWASRMSNTLRIKGLQNYILEDIVSIFERTDNQDVNGCIHISDGFYYSRGVTQKMANNDYKAKHYLFANLPDNMLIDMDVEHITARTIWLLVKGSKLKNEEERKQDLKNKLKNLKFDYKNKNEDITMFLSKLNLIFTNLKKLNVSYTETEKFNYLCKALPSDILRQTTPLMFRDNYNDYCEHLKYAIPKLKSIIDNNNKYNNSHYKIGQSNYVNKQTSNIKCYNCGKFGHVSRECSYKNMKDKHRNDYKQNKRNNNYKQSNSYNKNNSKNNKQRNKRGSYTALYAPEKLEQEYDQIFENALDQDFDASSAEIYSTTRNFHMPKRRGSRKKCFQNRA